MPSFNLKKIKHYLLLAFIFLLPWQTRWIINSGSINNGYFEYGTISLYAVDILLIILFLLSLKQLKFNVPKKYFLFLVCGLGFIIANIFFSLSPRLTMFHWLWLIAAGFISILIYQSKLSWKKLVLAFSSGAALSALLGLWQFFSQSSFASKWLGLALHNPITLGTSVIEFGSERFLRAYGSLDHPNMLGGLAAITLLFIFYLSSQEKIKKSILVITTIILTAGLVVSFSRAAWLAFLVGLIIMFVMQKQRKNLLLNFALCFLVFIFLFIPYHNLFFGRISMADRLENISISERVRNIQQTRVIFVKHPIIGSGFGTYGLALEKTNPNQEAWYYQPAHNVFLLILAEGGLVGLALAIIFLLAIFVGAWKKLPERRSLIASLFFALIIFVSLDHWLLSLHFGIYLLALVLTVVCKRDTLIS